MSFIIKYFTCKEKSGAVTKVKLVTRIKKHNQLYFGTLVLTSYCSEAVVQRCSVKKVFLEILQNSQENTCARDSFLIKLQARPATLLKKSLWHRCFPVNFAKLLRTPFFIEHLWWLLVTVVSEITHKYELLSKDGLQRRPQHGG